MRVRVLDVISSKLLGRMYYIRVEYSSNGMGTNELVFSMNVIAYLERPSNTSRPAACLYLNGLKQLFLSSGKSFSGPHLETMFLSSGTLYAGPS